MINNDHLLQASLGPLVVATVDQTQLATSLAPVENLKSLSLLSLYLSLYLNCQGAVAINVIVVFVFVFHIIPTIVIIQRTSITFWIAAMTSGSLDNALGDIAKFYV